MKHRLISILLLLSMLLSLLPATAFAAGEAPVESGAADSAQMETGSDATPADGDLESQGTTPGEGGAASQTSDAEVQTVTLEGKGTAADPYRIGTAETLVYAAEQMNADMDQTSHAAAHYVLTDDIDMQDVTYPPIDKFTGSLDGQDHTIRNLKIEDKKTGSIGDYQIAFIRKNGGTISNLHFEKAFISSAASDQTPYAAVAVVAGENLKGAVISRCCVMNSEVNAPGVPKVAGIVGMSGRDQNNPATVTGCRFQGKLVCGPRTGTWGPMAGGIAAQNHTSTLEYCAANAEIIVKGSSKNPRTGIICGYANYSTLRSNAALGGSITYDAANEEQGYMRAGRIYGDAQNFRTSDYQIADSSITVNNVAVSSPSDKDGITVTTDALKKESTWEQYGWDMEAAWKLGENGYPIPRAAGEIAQVRLSGAGTSADPYQLKNAEDLLYVAVRLNRDDPRLQGKCFVLTDDITLTEDFPMIESFSGVLDGDGHAIKNLVIHDTNTASVKQYRLGFVRSLSGTIQNLVFDRPKVTSQANSGSDGYSGAAVIVGLMEEGAMVSGCRVIDGEVNVPKLSKAGGLVCMLGYDGQWSATISSSVFTGTLTCGPRTGSYGPMAGGIAAYASTSTIEYCISDAKITVLETPAAVSIGGICGYTNSMTFRGDVVLGGGITVNEGVQKKEANRITGSDPYGKNIYANNLALDTYAVNGQQVTDDGDQQGISKTAAQLKEQSTYEAIGYNFSLQWKMSEEGYPVPKVFGYSSDSVNCVAVTPNGDASTEMSFSWQYQRNADGVVQLSTSKSMEDPVEFPAKAAGTMGMQYRAKATGLEPNTTYYYRVGSKTKQAFSEVGSFTTAPREDAFSLISLSDADAGDISAMTLAQSTLQAAQMAVPEAAFILHGGDMTGGKRTDWQYFYYLNQDTLMNTLIAPAAGEYDADGFTDYFNVGDTGYYSFDYANVHFAVLNTNEDGNQCISDTQLAWLRDDVALARENGAEWIILNTHKGPYTSGSHAQDEEIQGLREVLLPIIDELKIDLVIQGHDHILGRTYAVKDGKVTGKTAYTEMVNGKRFEYSVDPDGTIYMMPGTSGRKISQQIGMTTEELENYIALFARSDQRAGRSAGSVQTFAGITVDGGRLSVAVYEIKKSMNPTMIEGFGIDKEVRAVEKLIGSGNTAAARAAYNTLSDEQQKQITNYDALVSAESGIAAGTAGKWLDETAVERRAVTVRNDTDLEFSDVPVRVQIDKAPSQSMKFYTAAGEELPCEVENYNANGISTVWVRVPAVAAEGITGLWVYFGGKASSYAKEDVWNDNYQLVEHFAAPAGNGDRRTDSTGKQTGTVTGAFKVSERGGEQAATFANSKIQYGSVGDDYDHISVSAVVSLTEKDLADMNYQERAIVSKYYPGDPSGENTYLLGVNANNQLRSYYGCMWWRSNKAEKYNYVNALPAADGTPHLVTVTYDGFTVVTYIDGEVASEDTVFIESASFLNPDLPTVIGAYSGTDAGDLNGAFKGTLYEVQIAGQRTTAQWERFRADNYLGDAVTVGEAEKQGANTLSLTADAAGKNGPCQAGKQTVSGMVSQDAALTAIVGDQTFDLGVVQAGFFRVEVPVTGHGQQQVRLQARSATGTATAVIAFVTEDTKAPEAPELRSEAVSDGQQLTVQTGAQQGEKLTVQFYTNENVVLNETNMAVYEGGTNAYVPDAIDPLAVNYSAVSAQTTTTKTDEAPYQIYRITLDEMQRAKDSYHLTWQGESERQVHAYAYDLTDKKWVEVGATTGSGKVSIDAQIEGKQYRSEDGLLYVLFFRGLGCEPADMTSFIPEEGQYDFTMFWNSDTQYMSQFYPEMFIHQYQWIADTFAEKNGIITFNTGDISNRSNLNYEYNWRVTDDGYKILEENGVPYTFALGNHDYRYDGKPNEDRLRDTYFPVSRLEENAAGTDWTITTSGTANNICMKGEFGGAKIMLLSIGYHMQKDDINWAEQQVKNNPDYAVFILTHNFNAGGSFTGNATLRTQVIEKCDNIKLVFCGHIDGADLIRPYGDREFYGVLQDYQGEDTALTYGGQEFMRMVQFDLENDLVYFNTYSPLTGETLSLYGSGQYKATKGLYQKNKDEFAITLDLGATTERSFTTTGITLAAGSASLAGTKTVRGDTTATVRAIGLTKDVTYEWYTVLTDEAGNVTRSLPEHFTAESTSTGGGASSGGASSGGASSGGTSGGTVAKPNEDSSQKHEETAIKSFDDVAENAYYFDAVLWAVQNGLTKGTTETTFSPNNICTRGEMVTFLWRAAGEPEPTSTVNSFTDIDSNAYYYKAVLWAAEKGITSGTTSSTFSPNAVVTRGQTVTFLWRYADSVHAKTENPFTDVNKDAYYYEAVLWAVENGITNGTGDSAFSPNADCSRGQIVTFLWRYIAN